MHMLGDGNILHGQEYKEMCSERDTQDNSETVKIGYNRPLLIHNSPKTTLKHVINNQFNQQEGSAKKYQLVLQSRSRTKSNASIKLGSGKQSSIKK